MAVKDGLPATDFSRQNREWVKAVAGGGSGGGGLPGVTSADNGKILGVVNGEWGAMDAPGGGGGGDFSTATVTVTYETEGSSTKDIYVASLSEDGTFSVGKYTIDPDEPIDITVILYKGKAGFSASSGIFTVTGDIEVPYPAQPLCFIEGDGTISIGDAG